MSREHRDDHRYKIEALSKGLAVLEALEGLRWEPVNVATIMERTGLSRDTVDRTLKTLRLRGYAICEAGKWTAGKRLQRVSRSLTLHKL